MFWKKRKPAPATLPPQAASTAVQAQPTHSERLDDAARRLAASLTEYSEAAYRATQSEPDLELLEAKAKVDAARKLVTEGRLAYSLGRCLPEHMEHWPSWSKREDFHSFIGFDASDIFASSADMEEGPRKVKVANIEFTFNGTRYRFVMRDRGFSYVPDTAEKLGEVELHVGDQCVAKFEIIEDVTKDNSEWQFSDVRALKVSPWMRDVIDMSTQIEVSRQRWTTDFLDDRTREAAREIDLG